MIKSNFMIDNPLTGSKTRVIEGVEETNGMGWLLEVTCQPSLSFSFVLSSLD